jgi:hypothetical protein
LIGSLKDHLPVCIRVSQELLDQLWLLILCCRDHVADSFVYLEALVGFEVFAVLRDHVNEVDDVWLVVLLADSEHMLCRLGDLEEGLTGHVLDTWMLLMHELVQFLDDGSEESPMVAQERWELTDDIHNVRSYKSLVAFSLSLLAEVKELLNNADHKLVFVFIAHAP